MSGTLKLSGALKLGSLAAAPSNPEVGFQYYDSTLTLYRQWDGSQWVESADFSQLASTSGTSGAEKVGIKDASSQFTGTNVEDGLDEAMDAAQAAQSDATQGISDAGTAQTAIDSHIDGGASKHDGSEIDYERVDGSKKNIQAASDDIESAVSDVDDALGDISALGTPANYSTSSEVEVAARLSGIDTALATAGSADFADDTFRVSDNTDASKKIALEASGIATSTTRTITMPDENVDLGDMAKESLLASNSNGEGASLVGIEDASSQFTSTNVEGALDESLDAAQAAQSSANAAQSTADDAIPALEKAAVNGVATLDGGGKIPAAQLPNSVMEYKGNWVASTNTPALADGVGNAGDVYKASDAGSVDFGAGSISFAAGDQVIYSGAIWEKSINSNEVSSVNSKTGIVVINPDDLSDAATTNKFATAAQLNKVNFLTVTQAVDLDAMESDSASALQNVSEDLTPQLGGDLDVLASAIESSSDEIVLAGQNSVKRAKQASKADFIEEEYIHAISLAASQTNAVIAGLTFAHASIEGMELVYKIKEATSNDVRIGTIRVATNGTNVVLNDMSTETADTGISFDAVVNGANINVRYSSGTNGATMRADVKKIKA